MQHLTYQTLEGTMGALSHETLEAFAQHIRGGVLTEADSGYDEARAVWNGMVDRRPALIAHCLGTQDVRHAVDFARVHQIRVSIRGGGHHIAGNAVADRGMVIDLSRMRSVRVNAHEHTARVEAGALLGDVDHETQAFGLAVPLGINSTTGVAGLCLGGGFGWLTRKYGMTIDNLLSADVVTADGQLHEISTSQEPELFWALRGGGGNFGVVTSFEFKLHPVGPLVYAGLVVYPMAQAEAVLQAWRDHAEEAPRELSVWTVLRQAPPLPFLPESAHGQPVVVFALLYAGDPAAGEREAAKVLDYGTPLGHMLGTQPYAGFQTAFDPLLAPGARNYWKTQNFQQVSNDLIDEFIDAAQALPGPECEIFVAQLGGAAGEIGDTDTAYAGRDANFVMNVHGRWRDPAEDERVRRWSRQVFDATAPFATGGGYINFLTEDEAQRTDTIYGHNYPRLQQLKYQYDPANLFRLNQNIQPAPLAKSA